MPYNGPAPSGPRPSAPPAPPPTLRPVRIDTTTGRVDGEDLRAAIRRLHVGPEASPIRVGSDGPPIRALVLISLAALSVTALSWAAIVALILWCVAHVRIV